MVKHIELWKCEICEKAHESLSLAEVCEAKGLYDKVDGIEVGSIVVCPNFTYGWHDHPETCWVRKNPRSGQLFHYLYNPIWAVTAIQRKELHSHQTAYSLVCPVPPWGQIAHRWNCQSTHHKMELIEPSEGIQQWMSENFEEWRGKVAGELL